MSDMFVYETEFLFISPYETCKTRILFFKRYVRTITYFISAFAYPISSTHGSRGLQQQRIYIINNVVYVMWPLVAKRHALHTRKNGSDKTILKTF